MGKRGGGPAPFKFEESWFLEPDFMELIEFVGTESFFYGNASIIFALKLKNLNFLLKAWDKVLVVYFKEERKRCLLNIKELDLLEEDRPLTRGTGE